MFKYLLPFILIFSGISQGFANQSDEATHEELRGLLRGIENAVNTGNYENMSAFFHKNLSITTINQEVLSSREEIALYFNKWFGPGGYLKKLDISLKADASAKFYANKTLGIIRGSGEEKYFLSDKRYYDMQTRWTATVIKDGDDKWRILSLHIGTDFLNNPILTEAEHSLLFFAIGGLIVGFLLCGLIAFFLIRRIKRLASVTGDV